MGTKKGQIARSGSFFAMIFTWIILLAGQATCFASTVTLQWDRNTESDVAGYRVYYQADSSTLPLKGTGAAPVEVLKKTTATVSGLDPNHAYYFAVTAYNTSGVESSYSNIVSVPELVPPTISLSYPANNARVSGTISVTANASDNDRVAKIEYFVNGVLKATDTSTPYVFSWNTAAIAAGSYTLMTKAYDAAGNVGQSSNVSVTVVNDNTSPTVSVTSPANNATVSGTVAITASAGDNVAVSRVEFYENGVLLSASNVAPYSYSWGTTAVANGSYALTARAYDAAGNSGVSSAINITVNKPSTVQTATAKPTVVTAKPTVATAKPTVATAKPTVATTKRTVATTQRTVPTAQRTVATTKRTVPTAQRTVATTKRTVPTTQRTVATTQRTAATTQRTPVPAQRTVATAQRSAISIIQRPKSSDRLTVIR